MSKVSLILSSSHLLIFYPLILSSSLHLLYPTPPPKSISHRLYPHHFSPKMSTTAVNSPLIKFGNLTHKILSPPPSTSPTESVCCIPQQTVDSAFRVSTLKCGRFLVLYRCTAVFDPSMHASNAGFWQRWELCKGWEFELTPNGTVKYRGPYRELGSDTEREWTKGAAEIRKLVSPREPTAPPSKRQKDSDGEGASSKSGSTEPPTAAGNDGTPVTYRFALYGLGNHVSAVSTFPAAAGQGTWRRLVNEPQRSYRCTHVLYISLPELVGHIIACGVAAEDVPRSLQQGGWGCVKLSFSTAEWRGPEGMRCGRDMKPQDAWKEGWWYTWRPGMEVWVC